MKIAKILNQSVVDGDGIRTVIFFSGCSIKCPGCHNQELQNKRKGHNYNAQKLLNILKENFNNKITLSGGEPLEQHLDQLLEFILLFKEECKKRRKRPNIWIYSGVHYKFEDLLKDPLKKEIFQNCNVLVDGPFILSKKKELQFRGSSNQRIINLKKTFHQKEMIELGGING